MSITVDPASNVASNYGSQTTQSAQASQNDQFMKLLLAELQNQNPLEPMKDNEMMSQMAQLNSLNELTNIKTELKSLSGLTQSSYAASLLGKTVSALLPSGETINGMVTSTFWNDSNIMLNVGEVEVALSSVVEVKTE